MIHLWASNHSILLQVSHHGLWVHQVSAILPISQVREVSQAPHSLDHILVLHPLGVHRATLLLALLTTFKNSLMHIVAHTTGACMGAVKASAFVAAVWFRFA